MYRGVTRLVVALNQKANNLFLRLKLFFYIHYFVASKFAAFFECNNPCSIIGAQANFMMHVQSYAKTNKPYLWKSSTTAIRINENLGNWAGIISMGGGKLELEELQATRTCTLAPSVSNLIALLFYSALFNFSFRALFVVAMLPV